MKNRSQAILFFSQKTGILLAGLGITVAAALSGFCILVFPDSLAPLIVLAAAGAVAFLAACFLKPVLALYAALFFALIPSGMIQPETLHSWLNRGLTILALATWIFGILAYGYKIHIHPVAMLGAGFLLWSIISVLWSAYIPDAIQQLQVYILRIVVFLILIPNEIRTRQRLNGFINVIALVGLALFLVSVSILATQGYTPGVRFTIFKVNENMVGVSAMITLIGVLWLAAQPRKHRWLWNTVAGAYLLFVIGITAISGSRGATISLVVMIAIFFFWRSTRKWALLALVFLLIAVILFPGMFTTMVERFLLTSGDTLLNGREFTWQASWRVIESSPLVGIGIGGSRYAILPFLAHLLSEQLRGAAVHNPILTLWAETGLVGLLLYLWIPAAAIASFVRSGKKAAAQNDAWLQPYFAIISSIACGYFFSWYIGGGLQSDFSYFLFLSLLILPACLEGAATPVVIPPGPGVAMDKPAIEDHPG